MTIRAKRLLTIHFDACALYPPQPNEKAATNELLRLDKEGIINIEFPFVSEEELSKAPPLVLRILKGKIYIGTRPTNLIPEEIERKHSIRELLFGNKLSLKPNEESDINIVFEATKYHPIFLVTADGKHILSKAAKLKERFNLVVVCPSECLKKIKDLI